MVSHIITSGQADSVLITVLDGHIGHGHAVAGNIQKISPGCGHVVVTVDHNRLAGLARNGDSIARCARRANRDLLMVRAASDIKRITGSERAGTFVNGSEWASDATWIIVISICRDIIGSSPAGR